MFILKIILTGALFLPAMGVFAQDDPFDCPNIFQASKEGSISCVKLLVANGIDPNVQDEDLGNAPLHYAVMGGHKKLAQVLISNLGADPNIQNNVIQHTPLFYARGAQFITTLTNLGADPNITSDQGYTALHVFVETRSSIEEITALLDAGADPNIQTYDMGDVFPWNTTPFHLVVANGSMGSVNRFLSAKVPADPNVQDYEGRTALHLAEMDMERMQALLNAGADPNIKDKKGHTAFDYIAQKSVEIKAMLNFLFRWTVGER